jgi:hypothetical protein
MKKLVLLLVFAAAAFGDAPVVPLPADVDTAIAGTVNLEGSVTAGVTDLVTNMVPVLLPVGWILLAFFGAYALLQVLLKSTMQQVAHHYYVPLAMVVGYVAVLFRIVLAAAMLSCYNVPLPGIALNFHQMFQAFGNALSNAVTTAAFEEVVGDFNNIIHYLPPVGMFSVMPALISILVMLAVLLAQLGMTIITAGALAIIGVLTVCGPIMIPFYVYPGQEKRFWSWFDAMLSYSMYGFIGSCFILVFSHPYIDFFLGIHGWSVGEWVWNFLYMMLITVPFLWTMFKVPDVAHMLFGGMSGPASGFINTLQSFVVRGVSSLF